MPSPTRGIGGTEKTPSIPRKIVPCYTRGLKKAKGKERENCERESAARETPQPPSSSLWVAIDQTARGDRPTCRGPERSHYAPRVPTNRKTSVRIKGHQGESVAEEGIRRLKNRSLSPFKGKWARSLSAVQPRVRDPSRPTVTRGRPRECCHARQQGSQIWKNLASTFVGGQGKPRRRTRLTELTGKRSVTFL